jgi:hypothetical protein
MHCSLEWRKLVIGSYRWAGGTYSTIFNRMLLDDRIMEQQEHGNLLSIPKNDIPTTTEECRQITLWNTEYKILAHIGRNRLKPTLCLLRPSQYF